MLKMGRNTICCHQFAVLDCHRWEEVRFVATSLCSKMGKKYDLLPPVCGAGLSKMGGSTICCHQFGLKDGKKYDLLPPVRDRLPKMGRNTICCHQFGGAGRAQHAGWWSKLTAADTKKPELPDDSFVWQCCICLQWGLYWYHTVPMGIQHSHHDVSDSGLFPCH